jgi:hypothetical protein
VIMTAHSAVAPFSSRTASSKSRKSNSGSGTLSHFTGGVCVSTPHSVARLKMRRRIVRWLFTVLGARAALSLTLL